MGDVSEARGMPTHLSIRLTVNTLSCGMCEESRPLTCLTGLIRSQQGAELAGVGRRVAIVGI